MAISLFCAANTVSFCQLNLDSMFIQNFQFCDYHETATAASIVQILPIGLWVQMGTGNYWLLKPNGHFSTSRQYGHTEYGNLVGAFFESEYKPAHRYFRIQNVNDSIYRRIMQYSFNFSYGPSLEKYLPEFEVRDYNIDGSFESYDIDLKIGNQSFPARRVIYDLKDTYYILSLENRDWYNYYDGELERHLLSYNEDTEELQVVNLPIPFWQFIINNNNQIFFQSDSIYYKLNSDLSYEEVLIRDNLRYLGNYGTDDLIFFDGNRFEIYNDSLTALKNTIDYTTSKNDPIAVDGKDIYHYEDGYITKISENNEQSIVFQVVDSLETLPRITGIQKIGDRFCIYGTYQNVPYLHLFDDTVTSLSCNPIDECTDIILESITPVLMKAEHIYNGFGTDMSQLYALSVNADFEFTNNDTTEINSINLITDNLNHGQPMGYISDLSKSEIRAHSLNLPPGQTTTVNLDFYFFSKITSVYGDSASLTSLYSGLTQNLITSIESSNDLKICNESAVELNPQPLIPYLDRDCDGFIALEDCNDMDSLINPLAIEIPGNEIDENCDSILSTVDAIIENSEIQINPNPTSGMLTIESELSKFIYEIFSLSGETMASGSSTSEVDLSSLPPGLYFISITSLDRETSFIKKIIKI